MLELSEKKLKLVGLKCEDNFIHSCITVRELSEKFPNYLANIRFIFRNYKKFTVNSSTKIEKNDSIFLVVESENLSDVLKEFGHEEMQAKKAVIIPITSTKSQATFESSELGAHLAANKTPAVTIVAA